MPPPGRPSRLDVYQSILSSGVLPLFSTSDVEVATLVADACERAGIAALEFTNRADRAPQVFAGLVGRLCDRGSKLIVGAGSIVDASTAAWFVAAGAEFIVGPTFDVGVATFCNRRKIAYIPGCGSATEIGLAEAHGAEIVKLFPADALGGPGFVAAILGPSPWSLIMPTGGVGATAESVAEWIGAGAACLGIGSQLIGRQVLVDGDLDGLGVQARQLLRWVVEARAADQSSG
ncbi:MAG: bifunctional 4-hydroxy-2-oxoglutarate aldolase/2-dehydro-3-deoxy-phosphogluconate aldolase [Chloroflexi bacterium]|nr:bifunctional 4-hydroxy-2-oxoglutarate aldolase/2-dehydro-3-deoxy-phosphogluconate aldolase [Chloroflexota bacterium]